MLKNYFLTAWRNITKDRFYTFINIAGLAIGLTTAVFIMLYVIDELTYDKHHENHKRIYRLESFFTINNKDEKVAATQIPLGPTLKDEYPEIEEFVRLAPLGTMYFKAEGETIREDSIYLADSTLFKVFTHKMITGDPGKALLRPGTIVLTETTAGKFFGNTNPVGNTITTLDGKTYEITGVIEDLPGNSHLKFTGLISASTIEEEMGAERFNDRSAGSFWNVGIYTYVMLREKTSMESVLDKFPQFYDKYMRSIGEQINSTFILMAKPLARVHHYSSDLGFDMPGGNIKFVYIFTLVALLILIIASINYMNLATARSARRSKESGMRKIVGARRNMLIGQFITESVVITFISLVISLVLIKLLLPWFNILANKTLSFGTLLSPMFLGIILAIGLLVGFLSGSYPAFYLSSFNPLRIINNQTDTKGGSGILRKVLVVFQFAISVAMIIGTTIISSQFRYMQKTDPGFNKENLVVVQMADTSFIRNRLEGFRQELLKNPDIKGVAFSNGNPGGFMSLQVMRVEGDSGTMQDRAINNYFVDYEYIDLMGIEILEGRNYQRDISSDVNKAFIINETAAKRWGWVDSLSATNGNYSSALGKRFQWGLNLDGTSIKEGEVIGVVKDFHYASMRNIIEPLVLLLADSSRYLSYANVRISGENKQATITKIDDTRKQFNDLYPFNYSFLDENLSDYYRSEARISMLATTFTILTLIIAALGLFGLSSFLTQARTREIGVRKVLGASAENIMIMFMKEFSVWVIIANIIAAPAVLYFINRWLQSFPYKTEIHAWIFLSGLLISLVIAMATVSLRVYESANINPAEAIKSV